MRTTATTSLLLLALACSGDTPVTDVTDNTDSTDTTDTTDTTPTGSDTGVTDTKSDDKPTGDTGKKKTGPVDCVDMDLGLTVPQTVRTGTVGATDSDQSTLCKSRTGAGLEDVTFRFTAPSKGLYAFQLTDRTRMDAIIYTRPDCGLTELQCVNDTEFGGEVLIQALDINESVIVVVDGGQSYVEMNVASAVANEDECADSEDDDFDGLFDCEDDDCWTAKVCQEVCDNGKDDNGTGRVDCDDPTCFDDAICFEDCDNGIDDNGDGVYDCDDANQCGKDAACQSTCPDVTGSTLPQSFSGDTLGNVDDVNLSCGGALSGDVQIEYTATVTGEHVIDTVGSDYDTALSVSDTCGGKELACNDDDIGLTSGLVVSMTKGQSYIINIDGAGGDEGNFVVNVAAREKAESVCTDGRDLDFDGDVDCDDEDCAADKACIPPK